MPKELEFTKDVWTLFCDIFGQTLFDQSYRWHKDTWWLFNHNKPQRPLTEEEIEWHKARNHAPFVKGGIEKDDPDWFKKPVAMSDMRE